MNRKHERGQSPAVIAMGLLVIVVVIFAFFSSFDANQEVAQLRATATVMSETIRSYSIMFHNVTTPDPIMEVIVYKLWKHKGVVRPEMVNCIEVLVRWLDGSNITLPRPGKGYEGSDFAVFCPDKGEPPFDTIGLGLDVYYPKLGAAVSGTKVYGVLHFVQAVRAGAGVGKIIRNTDGKETCTTPFQILCDSDYPGSNVTLPAAPLNKEVVRACAWQENLESKRLEDNLFCPEGWQPAGEVRRDGKPGHLSNWMTLGPGWGILDKEHYVVLAYASGVQIIPMSSEYLEISNRYYGNLPGPVLNIKPTATPPPK